MPSYGPRSREPGFATQHSSRPSGSSARACAEEPAIPGFSSKRTVIWAKRIAAPAPKPQLPLASPGKRRWMMHGDLRPVPGLGPVGFTSAAAAPLRRGRSPTSTARPGRGAAQLDSASTAVAEPLVSSFPGRARWAALLPPPLRCATGGRQPARPAPGGARRSSTPLPTAAAESLSLRPRAGPGGLHFCRRRSTALRAVAN